MQRIRDLVIVGYTSLLFHLHLQGLVTNIAERPYLYKENRIEIQVYGCWL